MAEQPSVGVEDRGGGVGSFEDVHRVGAAHHDDAGFFGRDGDIFGAIDFSARTKFSSSATYSAYMNVAGYGLANARLGFRAGNGWEAFLWVRNITGRNYYEQLAAAPGGTGLIVGQPGDPRTFGITLRARF